MTGNEFIILAGKLATSADEASLRSAVSRAYYGAFHLAIQFLNDIERPVPQNANAHVVRRAAASTIGPIGCVSRGIAAGRFAY